MRADKKITSSKHYKYDVALSYAREDRMYAEDLADILRNQGVEVFYDRYEKPDLWGKNLYTHLADIYQNKARYCVMFLSRNYALKQWTKHEREAAQARAFKEREEYILPIRLDNTEIPGLPSTIAYLNWNEETIESIADTIIKKLGMKYTNPTTKNPTITKNITLFVLGRPGSGKTTAIKQITNVAHDQKWLTYSINEFTILREMYIQDNNHNNFVPTETGGFDVIDLSVLDTALIKIEQQMLTMMSSFLTKSDSLQNVLVTCEFTRDDYREALQLFSPALLRNSYFLYIDADIKTCTDRVYQRAMNRFVKEDFYVSDIILRTYFQKDNWDYMALQLQEDLDTFRNAIVINNTGSLQEFLGRMETFAKFIVDRKK
jgi:gluconate kinase